MLTTRLLSRNQVPVPRALLGSGQKQQRVYSNSRSIAVRFYCSASERARPGPDPQISCEEFELDKPVIYTQFKDLAPLLKVVENYPAGRKNTTLLGHPEAEHLLIVYQVFEPGHMGRYHTHK